jgi:predicted dehydrogenase
MKKIKVAIFGTGFMGRTHLEALRRLGNIEVVAVAGSSKDRARKFADQVFIENAVGDFRELLSDPQIEAVHICTPNSLHFEQAMLSMSAGKHVICEKPLAASVEEGKKMLAMAREKNIVHGTVYNMRAYPQVQQMKQMRIAGMFGDIRIVQGTYSQDWLFHDTDWNWRIESGKSRTFADIGTHWCDMVEHITGLKITTLSANLTTFIKTRKKPKGSVETFQGKDLRPEEYTEVAIDTEDFSSMQFTMGAETLGCMTTSQVSVGRKGRLFIEIFGSKCSVSWDAERPEELWIGHRDRPSELLLKDSVLLQENARSFVDMPGGLAEGYGETFKHTFRRFYQVVQDRNAVVDFPTFEDGIRQLQLVDAVIDSSEKHAWTEINAQNQILVQ